MNRVFLILVFSFLFISAQDLNAQQADRVQRGQRGYTPPPKDPRDAFIELKDVENELGIIIPKCTVEFKLDEFEKEIFKALLIKRIEGHNAILIDKANTRESRKQKISAVDKIYYSELVTILTAEEIEHFKIMDFTETKEEKKKKRKRKKRTK